MQGAAVDPGKTIDPVGIGMHHGLVGLAAAVVVVIDKHLPTGQPLFLGINDASGEVDLPGRLQRRSGVDPTATG